MSRQSLSKRSPEKFQQMILIHTSSTKIQQTSLARLDNKGCKHELAEPFDWLGTRSIRNSWRIPSLEHPDGRPVPGISSSIIADSRVNYAREGERERESSMQNDANVDDLLVHYQHRDNDADDDANRRWRNEDEKRNSADNPSSWHRYPPLSTLLLFLAKEKLHSCHLSPRKKRLLVESKERSRFPRRREI